MASWRWEGFSDDDINKLKCNSDSEIMHNDTVELACPSRIALKDEIGSECNKIPLAPQEEFCVGRKANEVVATSSACSSDHQTNGSSSFMPCDKENIIESHTVAQNSKSLTAALLLPALSESLPTKIEPKDFEAQQKLMEEKNRLRKVYLSKAIEDRTGLFVQQLINNIVQSGSDLQQFCKQLGADET